MKIGEVPPRPANVADLIDTKLAKKMNIDKHYAKVMAKFYGIYKDITHRRITEVKGVDYDRYYAEASDFVETMKKIIY